MKAAGVTTVICVCDEFSPIFLTRAADQQHYRPEWMQIWWPDPWQRLAASSSVEPFDAHRWNLSGLPRRRGRCDLAGGRGRRAAASRGGPAAWCTSSWSPCSPASRRPGRTSRRRRSSRGGSRCPRRRRATTAHGPSVPACSTRGPSSSSAGTTRRLAATSTARPAPSSAAKAGRWFRFDDASSTRHRAAWMCGP